MSNYKIAVVGPIPRDHITTHQGEVIEKYGCVTHPAIALSKLLGQDGEVIPVTHVRERDEGPIKEMLSAYGGLRLDHITSEADQGDVISLKFVDQNKRLEKQTAFMNPIVPEDVQDILDVDVFVFVPITDYEISLDTLKHIKANSSAVVIFDAHGPTNAMTVHGDRLIKFWADRDLWLPYIDVLKMNLEESGCCWFEKEYSPEEIEKFEGKSTSHLTDLARHGLSLGLKALIVTMDADGCMVYTLQNGEIVEQMVPSVKVDKVVDTTGCGDSFAGGLAFGLLERRDDYIKAAKFANALGALRTQGKSFEVFRNKEETEQLILENYSNL